MAIFQYIPPIVIAIFAFVGTYCLIFAYEKQYHVKKVMQHGRETTGKVVEIRQDPWNKEQVMVVVDYDTAAGVFKHFSQGYAQPCPYQVGQAVRVWVWPYKLRQTGRAALPDEKPGKAPVILLAVGIVLCLLSYPEIIRRAMLLF
jgi:hypothetical protein